MKNKKRKIIVIVIFTILLLFTICFIFSIKDKTELRSIRSETQLQTIYEGKNIELNETFVNFLTLPFRFVMRPYTLETKLETNSIVTDATQMKSTSNDSVATSDFSIGPGKEYSTTNIQVKNVDEADITKTDGDYIYSISNTTVIITDVRNAESINIATTIPISQGIPEDLILYQDKLTVISTTEGYINEQNTIVHIYNVQDKQKPILEKSYVVYQPYYTSRCINNKLYVISSGKLRKEDDKIITYYTEDNQKTDINLKDIKHLKDIDTNKQTMISMVDLDKPKEKIKINSYLMNIENAYVSENHIYLLNETYDYNRKNPFLSLFGVKGILGFFDIDEEYSGSYDSKTEIYKFNILEDGSIKYANKTKVEGKTINQFSLDEYEDNLRIALQNKQGSRIVIFNDKLEQIGQTSYLAKGEKMYSSRFLGNKAYLVTYKTVDPLYVIDLSNPTSPIVLGELKIPGYSTYLHPYDENHIIGIGIQSQEYVNRNSSGKVISTTAKITGMKMALFDVSNLNSPVQISSTVIGDSRTTSAILTNHKALLFSKSKELIAIPVNNYKEDFTISNSSEDYESMINSYKSNSKDYISEGYFIYNINLKNGFKLRGVINHETENTDNYRTNTKLLRGLYIENNLYTISENKIKVNRLDNLQLISELKIKGGE